MNKSTYEFTKIFAFLFLISSICFFFNGMTTLAIMAIATAVIIFFISSDWFFDNFNMKNHNGFVIFTTFILIFVNAYFIYQEFCNSSLFVNLSDKDKETYALYEKTLTDAISPCVDMHNILVDKMKADGVLADDIKNAHRYCYVALDKINSATMENVESSVLKDMSLKIKDNYKQIAINLTTYNYSAKAPQANLVERVNKISSELKNNLDKNRQLTKIVTKDKSAADNVNKDIIIKF